MSRTMVRRGIGFVSGVLTTNHLERAMNIPQDEYRAIEQLIMSADSPVGIDAKKTHVYIIHMLEDIQKRVRAIEEEIKFQSPEN